MTPAEILSLEHGVDYSTGVGRLVANANIKAARSGDLVIDQVVLDGTPIDPALYGATYTLDAAIVSIRGLLVDSVDQELSFEVSFKAFTMPAPAEPEPEPEA